MRYLLKVRVTKDGDSWALNSEKAGIRTFRGSAEEFAKYLQRIRAKDTETEPRSVRGKTYQQIANEIADGKASHVYIWSHDYPDSGNIY